MRNENPTETRNETLDAAKGLDADALAADALAAAAWIAWARLDADALAAALAGADVPGHPGHPVTCRRRCCAAKGR